MGWWSISDEKKEYVGDDSADAVTTMLIELGALRKDRQAPTLQSLLDCLATALRSKEDSGRYKFNRLTARLSNGLELEANRGHRESQAMIDAVRDGLAEVETAYRDEFERSPTLREIVDSFSFVLGHRPSRFLSELEDVEVQEIRAE